MDDEIPGFQASLGRLLALFDAVPESVVDIKPRRDDWSVKEIACHLVDSASNNHQRFTRLQRARRLEFPAYEAEPWVAVEKAQTVDWSVLLTLLESYSSCATITDTSTGTSITWKSVSPSSHHNRADAVPLDGLDMAEFWYGRAMPGH
jgi:hypothetical protein